jgi:two-component system, chemotaxis family, chemotaxis protein CheY
MRILIVDDSRAMRMIITRTLRQAGYKEHTIEEAGDGAAALEAIRASAPDVVMSDWNMPVMNGIELLEALQKDGAPPTFGFLTTEGSDEMRERAKNAGAKFFITKPFTPEAFQDALSGVM